MNTPVVIDHFSDVLCVWAYVAQIRIDELQEEYGDQVKFNYHFMNIFGAVDHRIQANWKEKGGYAGFGKHVLEVAENFPHVEVHPEIWQGKAPKSSANAHLFLKAVNHLIATGEIEERTCDTGRSLFEEITWQLRLAFFRDNRNIADLGCQCELAEQLELPSQRIREVIADGSAMAGLCRDIELAQEHSIEGSPTYLLNEGRQKLYGNVGYNVISANVKEVLNKPDHQASWC